MNVLLRWDGRNGDRGPSVMGRGYLSLTILSNIHRSLKGNIDHLYLNDVTNFLGIQGGGRNFLGTLSLWTEDVNQGMGQA